LSLRLSINGQRARALKPPALRALGRRWSEMCGSGKNRAS